MKWWKTADERLKIFFRVRQTKKAHPGKPEWACGTKEVAGDQPATTFFRRRGAGSSRVTLRGTRAFEKKALHCLRFSKGQSTMFQHGV
jgi:hypothetical protein